MIFNAGRKQVKSRDKKMIKNVFWEDFLSTNNEWLINRGDLVGNNKKILFVHFHLITFTRMYYNSLSFFENTSAMHSGLIEIDKCVVVVITL